MTHARGRGARLALALALTACATVSTGCMTSRYLMTDYDERTSGLWLEALAIDVGVGGALIGGSCVLGRGDPEPISLSTGIVMAGLAILVLPLATWPDPPERPEPESPYVALPARTAREAAPLQTTDDTSMVRPAR